MSDPDPSAARASQAVLEAALGGAAPEVVGGAVTEEMLQVGGG